MNLPRSLFLLLVVPYALAGAAAAQAFTEFSVPPRSGSPGGRMETSGSPSGIRTVQAWAGLRRKA
jgi:hypothetical protein